MKQLLLSIALLGLFSLANAEDTIYVSYDGFAFTSAENHQTWDDATDDLQAAIDAVEAAGGGQVWVAEGIYVTDYDGLSRSISFYPKNGVAVYGGFAGTETSIDQRQRSDKDGNGTIEPWEWTYLSRLSGDVGSINDSLDNAYHVINGEGTDSTAFFDGFTVEHGNAWGAVNASDDYGAGVYKSFLQNSSIRWCAFSYRGSAAYQSKLDNIHIYANRSNIIYQCQIVNSLIMNNLLRISQYSKFINSIIHSNTGLVSSFDSLYNCKIYNNQADVYPSALLSSYAINCLIFNNNSGDEIVRDDESATRNSKLTNCIVANNSYSWREEAGDTKIGGCEDDTLINCIVWGNRNVQINTGKYHGTGSVVSYSAVQDGFNGEENINLSAENEAGPKFVNPTTFIGWATTPEQLAELENADWSLLPGSPCIDMGYNGDFTKSHKDLAGNQRIINGTIDIGPYEAKVSIPAFEIDYAAETTDRPVPDYIHYNTEKDFSGDTPAGENVPLALEPGQTEKTLFFKIHESDTTTGGIDSLIIPARPTAPTTRIQYVEESLLVVPDTVSWLIGEEFADTLLQNNFAQYIPAEEESADTLICRVAATDSSFVSDTVQVIIPPRPAAPANATADDENDTFGWDWSASGFEAAQDYEYSTNKGTTWQAASANPVNVGDVALAAGMVQVRVAASMTAGEERFASAPLLSQTAFTEKPEAIEDTKLTGSEIQIYPIPAKDHINVALKNNSIHKIVIYSITGSPVETFTPQSSACKLDISEYNRGLYILVISTTDGRQQTHRIIKK